MMRNLVCGLGLASTTVALALPATALTIDWVTVGIAGNAADANTGFGAVSDVYRIAATEVTNAQYAEFLNAVAATDTRALYSTSMGSGRGGITRSGSPGSYSYSAIAGREEMPVNYVSFYDALRFANWLHNGQPSGGQDHTTTEDGAYTFTAEGVVDNSMTRNPWAKVFLPSEDEWYKAAYHDTLGLQETSYFAYPAGVDTQATCAAPTAVESSANCDGQGGDTFDDDPDDLTPVGSFAGAANPYGTFDQGGNAWEWNEAIINEVSRGIRGGAFVVSASELGAAKRNNIHPSTEIDSLGLRVATLPEPGAGLLLMAGALGLAGMASIRRFYGIWTAAR